MIAELQAERERLDNAILALERLSRTPEGKQHKRGRPPKEVQGQSAENKDRATEELAISKDGHSSRT